jgi:6-phosphogluconate dehydrogenase
MKLGLIGLGRMGANMARRLHKGGIEVSAWNRNAEMTDRLAAKTGLSAAASLEALVAALPAPEGVEQGIPTLVMSLALTMRKGFGGHGVQQEKG